MAKFYGVIGYVVLTETKPGVFDSSKLTGLTSLQQGLKLVELDIEISEMSYIAAFGRPDDINVANEISIVADPFAYQNFHSMRYVEFMGAKWKISKVEVLYPRTSLLIKVFLLKNIVQRHHDSDYLSRNDD